MKCKCGSTNLVASEVYPDMMYCRDCKDGILKSEIVSLTLGSLSEQTWCRCGSRQVFRVSAEEYQCKKCNYVAHIEDSVDLVRNPPQKLQDVVQRYGLGVKIHRNFDYEGAYYEVLSLYKEYADVYLCKYFSKDHPKGKIEVCGTESDRWGWTKV